MSWNWISIVSDYEQTGQQFVLMTVTQCTGSTPRGVGTKMIILPDGKFYGTIGGGNLEALAMKDALDCLAKGVSQVFRYPLGAKVGQCCGGVVEIFMEVFGYAPRLYVFGAGHVGQAICRTLSGTPFRIQLIDERTEWIDSKELPAGVIRFRGDWSEFVREAVWDKERTYAVVMTHRHDVDQEIIADLIRREARYIGLIGSDAKWERFQQRLLLRGFSKEELQRVNCPIGVDTGGKAPQEIAISFGAEIISKYYGKG